MEVQPRQAFTVPPALPRTPASVPAPPPSPGPTDTITGIDFKATSTSVPASPSSPPPAQPTTSAPTPGISLVSRSGTQVAASSAFAPLTEIAPEPAPTHSPGLDFRTVLTGAAKTVGHDLSAARFVGEGLVYKLEQAATGTTNLLGKNLSLGLLHPEHDLDKLPVPKIDTPLVMVPGWRATPADYAPLVNHLTADGANGGQPYYVKQGQFYTMGADNQLQPVTAPPSSQAKVFEMVFTDNHQGPEKDLPEMRENLQAITQATGAQKVDALAHSMGGIDTRLYLDQGGEQINRLMMVGTPNHGTPFGNMATGVVDNGTGWAESVGGLTADDTQSLQALQSESGNSFLQHLDHDWSNELSHVAAVQTEANGALPTGFGGGDGLVPTSSVAMPGATNKVHYEAITHKDLTSSPKIFADMNQFFGWGA